MDIVVCQQCNTLNTTNQLCHQCGIPFVREGIDKNVIDQFSPTCLVHRYEGSDMLEPATIVKKGKQYYHVATKLLEYAHPARVPKNRVFGYSQDLLNQVNELRQERRDYMDIIDIRMAKLWSELRPLS